MTTTIRGRRASVVTRGVIASAIGLLGVLIAPSLAQAAGQLDPSFGGDGKVVSDFGNKHEGATSTAIDSKGRLVVGGSAENVGRPFLLARYRANGSLDPSFGDAGVVKTHFGSATVTLASIAIDSQGRIVAAGRYYGASGDDAFALARYKPDGSLDTSFGNGGKVKTDTGDGDGATSVALDQQGRIVVEGSMGRYSHDGFKVLRYRPNGTLDHSFGVNGMTSARIGWASSPSSVAIDSLGRIVAAGTAYTTGPKDGPDFALARFLPNGNLDTSFAGDGKVILTLQGEATGSRRRQSTHRDGSSPPAGATAPRPAPSPSPATAQTAAWISPSPVTARC